MSMTISPLASPLRNPFAVRWTRADCEKLVADGFLDYPYELVEREIIRQMPQNIPHRTAIALLTGWLYVVFGVRFVQSHAAIDVRPEENPTSQPEPDVAVLSVPLQSLMGSEVINPTAEQVRLVVEISDSTLAYDLTVKAGLYARAEIAEYWVVDLNARTLHVLRQPNDGQYQDIREILESENIATLAVPEQFIAVRELLP